MNGTTSSPSLSKHRQAPDAATIACVIRDCLAVMANDLETIRVVTAGVPECADSVQRLRRQVAELERLAGELYRQA
jgi:hypothetical protein